MDDDLAREELVAGWWEFQRLANGTRDERKALEAGEPTTAQRAVELVDDMVDRGAPGVVELLATLAGAAPLESGTALVGAGPLESLLHRHGEPLIGEIEKWARQAPAFAEALAAVWLDTSVLGAENVERLSRWVRS